GSPHLIVESIKSKYEIYKMMYMDNEEEDAEFSLPADLVYDSEINMQAPLKGNITITSPFGGRGSVYKNGQIIASGDHNGIDLYASNKSIYAAGNGVVYRTYTENTGGNIVEIMHTTTSGKRYISQYAHLSQILVSKGEEVKAGDLIAIMGCTGSACSGTHLHFGIKDFDSNKWLNPRDIVKRAIS
ncbi:MAG: M23 family metallopeptidase, partial [Bacilli bacterium]|nr:M23 family metallopeptidase [Bacilli bacterium]